MNTLTAKQAHIETIQHQIVISNQLMQDCLDRGDFRKAEMALDQLTSYKRLLETAS